MNSQNKQKFKKQVQIESNNLSASLYHEKVKSLYHYSSVIRQESFLLQKQSEKYRSIRKNIDPFLKTDLDFWDCLRRVI